MAFFPLFVNLEEKPVLVIGGGAIAERRGLEFFGKGFTGIADTTDIVHIYIVQFR
mgnify:CR=1 FL=1